MAELLGIIAPLRKFMSNTKEEIYIDIDNEKRVALLLKKDRAYNIPDFQREIRWTCDNVAVLVEDIKSGHKFLGNIILTKHSETNYSIIDGQQRITILTMILSCINRVHKGEIEVIDPCRLTIESFSKFPEMVNSGFAEETITEEVYGSDKLKQIAKYIELWRYISELDVIKNRYEATKFLENLGKSSFNVIINEADDVGEGIRYFIDVNLKGKQLDVEDIFKSYLFRNDSREQIRKQWYLLKTLVVEIEKSKMEYSLLKLLEHYFLCDLYTDNNFKGMEFGTDFLLKKPHKHDNIMYREGTHLIEVINSNKYMVTSLEHLNQIIKLMLEIVNSESITRKFREIFSVDNAGERIDNVELKVIHNIIGKILKDTKILPKALLIKYFIVLMYNENSKSKESIRTIYGIYLFTVLFTIFENKKTTDVLVNVIKANEKEWYGELVKQIDNYFALERITDARLQAQYKFGQNEDEEDQRFRCKSLATVYNYFIILNGSVCVRNGEMNELHRFITDDDAFSMEHFIISESRTFTIIVDEEQYAIEKAIYNRYVNNFFNFIFIEKKLNSQLGNNWLPQKLKILTDKEISCEYSSMAICELKNLGNKFSEMAGTDYKDKLDLFFHRDFKELYIEYAKSVLNNVIKRINDDENLPG